MLKNYVLDTCTLLQDPNSIYSFEDNIVIIPIGVIEELDKFKKDMTELGRNARQSSRLLDELRLKGDLRNGVSLGEHGVLKVSYNGNLQSFYKEQNVDLHVIHIAQETMKNFPDVPCVIISQDVNVRIRANALGIQAEGYENGSIHKDELDVGYREVIVDKDIFSDFIHNKEVFVSNIKDIGEIPPNYYVILANNTSDKTLLGRVSSNGDTIIKLINAPRGMLIKPINVEQKFLIDALLDQDIKLVAIAGKAGTGKSQPISEPILTPSGWVKMGEVKQGDFVFSSDGEKTKVISIHPQGVLKIYNVTFSDGSSTRCSEDHLWFTKTSLDRDYHRNGSCKKTSDILNTIKYGKNKKQNHSIPITSPIQFCKKDLLIDPYIMGSLLGDGGFTVQNRVTFTTSDSDSIKYIQNLLPIDTTIRKKSKYDYYFKGVNLKHKKCSLVNHIGSYGLFGKKSFLKFIPSDYLFSSVEDRISLLQGLMDTDGTLDYRNGKCAEFNTTSEKLSQDIVHLVQSLGGVCSISYKIPKFKYKGETKNGLLCYRIRMTLPHWINPFRISRKSKEYKPNLKYVPVRFIEKIELVGEEECQCIFIENSSHLYITNNFIVTHNTLLSVSAAHYLTKDEMVYKRMLVSRPIFPMGKDVGYLPGELSEKLDPWMQPIYDAFDVITGFKDKNIKETIKNDPTIVVEPLTYIRGRSIHDQILIVDEAQNLTPLEIKTIITRAGANTKIVLTGDIYQIDNPYIDSLSNGLSVVINAFRGSKIATSLMLEKGVRSELAEEASNKL